MKSSSKRIITVLIIIIANIALDQWTKLWARETLRGSGTESYLDDFFRLLYVENRGAFLSMGSGLEDDWRMVLLHVLPAILLVALTLYAMFSKALNWWQMVGISFIIGGGISNVYDRIMYGSVTDFMNLGIGDLRTGIFNFADVSIMVGLFIMLPFAFQREEKKVVAEEEE